MGHSLVDKMGRRTISPSSPTSDDGNEALTGEEASLVTKFGRIHANFVVCCEPAPGLCTISHPKDPDRVYDQFPVERIYGLKYEIGRGGIPEVVLWVAKLNPKCIPAENNPVDPVAKWQYRPMSYTVKCDDVNTLDLFYEQIQDRLAALRAKRPSKLRVFINPVGGKKTGVKQFQNIRPLFSAAGIEVDVTVTRYAGHAGKCAQEELFDGVDGIVVVGGDGMFSEVLNGLHARKDKVRPTVGLLPAGSTNTVVLTVMRNPSFESAALNIVLGRKTYLDQGLIERKDRPNFYFSNFVGFGFFGDVIDHSEHYRWCGPARYQYSGFINLLKGRSYEAEISYQKTRDDPTLTTVKGRYKAINVALMACITKDSEQGMAPSKRCDDGTFHLILVKKCSRLQYLRYLIRTGGTGNQFALPHVDMIEACKVIITASPHNRGWAPPGNRWNVDGELLDDDQVTLTNMLHSMKIYGCSARNELVPPRPGFRYGRRRVKKTGKRALKAPGLSGYPCKSSSALDTTDHMDDADPTTHNQSMHGYDSPTLRQLDADLGTTVTAQPPAVTEVDVETTEVHVETTVYTTHDGGGETSESRQGQNGPAVTVLDI
eukprot:m.80209 g.80209  ORF g.80209 m.80209 type:complete len:600 (+) comp9334_c0_seq2:271-2070(+)